MNPTRLNPAKENLELKRIIREQQLIIEDLQIAKREICDTALQMSHDVTVITLSDQFHIGPKRYAEFYEKYKENFHRIAELVIDDEKAGDAEDLVFSRTTVDKRLSEIVGDDFAPWCERYEKRRLKYVPIIPTEVHDDD